MPARAISSGTISFGLVSIPVKLYAATRSKAVRFNMLDPRDSSRVRQKYVNASTGEEVDRDKLVKGYEYSRGQYVVFSDEELKGLESQSDRSIEIEEFVPITQVDPIYFERSSLLGPDKGGHKAYRLLCDAMRETGRVALGRYAARGRQQLVLLRPYEEGLVLQGLWYADEVRHFADEDIDVGTDARLKEGELELATQLIDQLSRDAFEPERYEDTYRQRVLEAVDRKVAGEEVVAPAAEEPREQIVDLVAALKRSLEEKRGAAKAGPKRAGARKASTGKTKGKGKGGSGGRKAASGKS